jgi:homoserine O-acetyltransferase/O-succinyltransferase
MKPSLFCLAVFCCLFTSEVSAAEYRAPEENDFVLKDFHFRSGESLSELRIHYRTVGAPTRNREGQVKNAVLILHGTTGSGGQFIRPEFAGELFGQRQLLDAEKFYLILPDNIGHGKSSKPSDGLKAKFPKYGYLDMIEAQRRLLVEGLAVDHLRLVIGTSMGGMHTWLWGSEHPDFMDALMPLASLPEKISGRNRVWRKMIIDAITTDPEWLSGDYTSPPRGFRFAAQMSYFMGNNPVQRQIDAPNWRRADELLDAAMTNYVGRLDANDVLYAFRASEDYDPGPGLQRIRAPLLAINFEDDLINPPELKLLEREIKKVKLGKAVLVRRSDATRGHGTHTLATVWKEHLKKLLKRSK